MDPRTSKRSDNTLTKTDDEMDDPTQTCKKSKCETASVGDYFRPRSKPVKMYGSHELERRALRLQSMAIGARTPLNAMTARGGGAHNGVGQASGSILLHLGLRHPSSHSFDARSSRGRRELLNTANGAGRGVFHRTSQDSRHAHPQSGVPGEIVEASGNVLANRNTQPHVTVNLGASNLVKTYPYASTQRRRFIGEDGHPAIVAEGDTRQGSFDNDSTDVRPMQTGCCGAQASGSKSFGAHREGTNIPDELSTSEKDPTRRRPRAASSVRSGVAAVSLSPIGNTVETTGNAENSSDQYHRFDVKGMDSSRGEFSKGA